MPPQQHVSSTAAMLGQIGALVGFAPGGLGVQNPNDLYVGILRSRTISDALITQFDLIALYESDSQVDAREKLAERTRVSTGKDGLIAIEVEDHDPERASRIANAYVEQLEKLTSTLAVTEASQRRLFFEKQVARAKDDLVKAEMAFKETQEKTGLLQLDQQGRAVIEAVADLRARIVAKEVELSALRTFATPTNPNVQLVRQELAGLREELKKIESASGGSASLMVGSRDIPSAGLQYARSIRELKYAETILELMARQYELARVEEARDSAAIQVVDRAVPPDENSGPRRGVIIAAATLVAAVLTLFGVLIFGAWLRPKDDADQAKIQQLFEFLRIRR